MDKHTDLILRLQDEADLCRNDGATDIAALLDEAVEALRDRNHDTAVGEKWRTDSRLEEWFPLTAERMASLEAENAALKRDLQYARDGLTKGRTRMREDIDRLRRELKAAERFARPRQPLTRAQIDAVMTEHYPLSSLLREEVDAFEACVRDLERLHGIGA